MLERLAEFRRLLEPVLEAVELKLHSDQLAHLARHYSQLVRWNSRINLTAIRDIDEIVERHFGESLFVAKLMQNCAGTLADVGSGAGFPGVPLGVSCPKLRVTLIESNARKAAFLKEVVRPVANVEVFHGRLEEVSRTFDWATIRAVNPDQITRSLNNLADNVAFLVGRQQAIRLRYQALWEWQAPEPLPWGRQRVLLLGKRVEKAVAVPRGT